MSADSVKERPSGGPCVSADPGQDGGAQAAKLSTPESGGVVACKCSGNCGRPACSTRQSRNQRGADKSRCSGVPRQGSQYCKECACGVADCPFLRNNKDGRWRWCKRHCRLIGEGGVFVSRGAIRQMDSTWSRELQIVATNAWWLHSLAFEDFVAFDYAYQQELESGAGAGSGVLGQSACLRLWVAAWLHHGDAIRNWVGVTQGERGVSARSTRWGARDWADAVASVGRDVLESGAVLASLSRRQHLGLVEFLRLCGMELTTTSGKRKREELIVGAAGRQSHQSWDLVLRTAFADGLAVPRTSREFRDIVPMLGQRLCQFPPPNSSRALLLLKQGSAPTSSGSAWPASFATPWPRDSQRKSLAPCAGRTSLLCVPT